MTHPHQHSAPPSDAGAQATGPQPEVDNRAARWEERYASVEQLWSGHPND